MSKAKEAVVVNKDMTTKKKQSGQKTVDGHKSIKTVGKKLLSEKMELSLPAMLKAGMHFGHKKTYWNPKMSPYIFGTQNGIHIIDLEKSLQLFKKVLGYLEEIAEKGGMILIVGTKNQARGLTKEIAGQIGMPYVNNRWLGGTFTNFNFIKKRLQFFLNNLDALEKGKLNHLTKLERNKLQKKLDKIAERMGGLIKMTRLPDAVIVLDTNKNIDVIREAKKSGVKVVGILDTNSDPDLVDYGIPANDDAVSSLKYILQTIAQPFKK